MCLWPDGFHELTWLDPGLSKIMLHMFHFPGGGKLVVARTPVGAQTHTHVRAHAHTDARSSNLQAFTSSDEVVAARLYQLGSASGLDGQFATHQSIKNNVRQPPASFAQVT